MGRFYRWATAALLLLAVTATAGAINAGDITPTLNNEVQSGNGLLDYILFLEAGGVGVAGNTAGSFNGDNANTDLPTGSGTTAFDECFATSIGELRDFYILNFPDGQGGSTIGNIVLFLDLNEIGPINDVTLESLQVIVDYNATYGNDVDDPFNNDITSQLQNAIRDDFQGGGTIAAELESPVVLALNEQGAGFADYRIATNVNPFDAAFDDEDRIMFCVGMTNLDDGGETIFLSGSFGDIPIPEPATLSLLALGGLAVLRRKRS